MLRSRAVYSLPRVGLQHQYDAALGDLHVQDLLQLLEDPSHQRGVCLQQAADGAQGDGPVAQPGAHQHAAAHQRLLLGEGDADEAGVGVGLPEVHLRQLLHLIAEPEDAAQCTHALQSWRNEGNVWSSVALALNIKKKFYLEQNKRKQKKHMPTKHTFIQE